MKVFYATRNEVETFRKAVMAIRQARITLDDAGSEMALAGCGTFNCLKDYGQIKRASKSLERMYQKLGRRLDIASANAPSINPNTSTNL